jgi:hypothetical protein
MGPGAYTSIGGLDKQIAQIRDLLEIPLTRPDLFRHFGKLLPFAVVFFLLFLTYGLFARSKTSSRHSPARPARDG